MARQQTARRQPDPIEGEDDTIPPDRPHEGEKPIPAAGAMADLNPAPVTPRPFAEEEDIAQRIRAHRGAATAAPVDRPVGGGGPDRPLGDPRPHFLRRSEPD